jgi:hypothetical protein
MKNMKSMRAFFENEESRSKSENKVWVVTCCGEGSRAGEIAIFDTKHEAEKFFDEDMEDHRLYCYDRYRGGWTDDSEDDEFGDSYDEFLDNAYCEDDGEPTEMEVFDLSTERGMSEFSDRMRSEFSTLQELMDFLDNSDSDVGEEAANAIGRVFAREMKTNKLFGL